MIYVEPPSADHKRQMNRETVRPESFRDEALFILDEVDQAYIFSIEPKRLFPSFAKNGKKMQFIRALPIMTFETNTFLCIDSLTLILLLVSGVVLLY